MTVLSAFCAAFAVLLAVGTAQWIWVVPLALLPAALATGGLAAWTLGSFLSVALYLSQRPQASKPHKEAVQVALAHFWQTTAVLLSAGLTFLQAVEVALHQERLVQAPITEAIHQLTHKSSQVPVLDGEWGVDGMVTAVLLQHGYVHGIAPGQIDSHVRYLQDQVLYRQEAKKRRDPLWMTVLPAVLLVNVLALFVTPMIELVGRSWLKI